MYIYNEILFSHKKREILLFATTWMDLVGIIPNQTEKKDKYHMMSLNVDSEKTNKHTKQ